MTYYFDEVGNDFHIRKFKNVPKLFILRASGRVVLSKIEIG